MLIENIIENSLIYPSGDNCQPFRFKILSESEFEIHYDEERGRHRLNYQNLASWLTLGCLIETLNLQALLLERRLQFEIFDDSESAWALVKMASLTRPASESDLNLARNAKNRCVDRRLYSNSPLPTQHLHWLLNESSQYKQLTFSYLPTLSYQLMSLMLEVEEKSWTDLKIVQDLFHWVRFSKESVTKTQDGMPWKSLALPWFFKPILKWLAQKPHRLKILTSSSSTRQNRRSLLKQIRASAGFGWISISSYDKPTVVSAGRCYLRMWIYLNSYGCGFQPISFSTFGLFARQHDLLPEDWSQVPHSLYQQIQTQIQQEAGTPPNAIPIWAFRTGLNKPMPDDARSLRRDLSKVLLR